MLIFFFDVSKTLLDSKPSIIIDLHHIILRFLLNVHLWPLCMTTHLEISDTHSLGIIIGCIIKTNLANIRQTIIYR